MAPLSVQDDPICFLSQREVADSGRMCNDSQVVWLPRSCDIVLGRGAGLLKHAGNVKFRERIGAHQDEYNSSNRHRLKQHVARRVRQEIRRTGARFLSSIKTEKEARRLGLPTATKAWYITSEDVVMTKIKQALREWQPSEKGRGVPCAVPKVKGHSKDISERHAEPLHTETTFELAAPTAPPSPSVELLLAAALSMSIVQMTPTPRHLVSTVPNVPPFPLTSRNPLSPPATSPWLAFPTAATTTFSPALLTAGNDPSGFLLDALLRLHSQSDVRQTSLQSSHPGSSR